jgi:hypothetical protein
MTMPLQQAFGNPTYNLIKSGQINGSATAVQLPNIPCSLVMFKALSGNAGKIYLGTSSSMTTPNPGGGNNTTAGIQLSPGDLTPWLPLNNLNLFYLISDNANDTLTYLIVN